MKKIIGLIIVILLSYWTIRPLFGGGYFPMHDDAQVARVVEMGRALREGQFPVRWVSGLGYGYGYPIFNFYGPLPYYAGGFFYALGFTGLTATKIMMGIGLVAAGVTMYIAGAEILGVSAGILAGALYMYAPYRAVDAYVRGAVGEYWALLFLPLILLGFWRKNILVGSLGVAGFIVSHTILGYAGMLFVALAAVMTRSRRHLVPIVLLGVGLSAFFWLPAISEMQYTNVASQVSATADYRDHFVCLPQLWNSYWGFGGSAKGCLDGLSFKIGKVHLVLAGFSLLGILFGFLKNTRSRAVALAGVSIFLLSVFFMLPISLPVWQTLPLFSYVQYPWRFLAFAIFGISLAASGFTLYVRPRILRWIIVSVTVGITIFVEAKRFMPQYSYGRPASEFETISDISFRASHMSDEYLPPAVVRPTKEEDVFSDTIPGSDTYELLVEQNTNTYKKFSVRSGQDNTMLVRTAYFPGWHYTVNENVVYPPLERGLPILTIPGGFSVVQMQFRDTGVRVAGNVISLISVGVYFYLYDKQKKANA